VFYVECQNNNRTALFAPFAVGAAEGVDGALIVTEGDSLRRLNGPRLKPLFIAGGLFMGLKPHASSRKISG
jgi:hypothetical protein